MKFLSFLLLLCVAVSAQAQLEQSHSIVFSKNAMLVQKQTISPQLNFPQFSGGNNPLIYVPDPTLPTRLDAALNATFAKTKGERHGVSASVIVPGLPQWDGSAGESYPGKQMAGDLQFEIASNSKTITTALIMKLKEQGILSLTDSIYHWLPQYPNIDSTITIKQLLNHSSGIFDYLNDDTTLTLLTDMYFGHPDKQWTAEEILQTYVGKPNFKPGKSYRYCNTNFLILGMIAEKATGVAVATSFRNLFFDPLQLTKTFSGWAEVVPNEYAHNFASITSATMLTDLGTINKTAQLSAAHSAGGVVSTPHELALWAKYLYEGYILQSTSNSAMIKMNTWPDGSQYGLGTIAVPYYTKKFYGHGGHLIGFTSDMFNNPTDSITVVVYINAEEFANDVSLNDYAVALLDEIYKTPASVSSSHTPTIGTSVYPNPVSHDVVISYELNAPSSVSISLFDLLGREVLPSKQFTNTLGKQTIRLDLHLLPEGCYIYHLTTNTGTVNGKIQVVH